MKQRCSVVAVDGLIGCGKSTLVNELGVALGPTCLIMQEPDERSGANPYLADYYKEPTKWALTMQVHLLAMRFRMHMHAQWHAMQGYGPAIIDRPYQGDTCFARLQLKRGIMAQREFDSYQLIYHAMTASVLQPTVFIRVLASPTVCQERIAKRLELRDGRKCESGISLDYLQDLDRELDHMISVLKYQGVIVFDVPWAADRDSPETRKQTVEDLAERILAIAPPDIFLDLHRRTL